MQQLGRRVDIFCAVIDNFGDIGVCWRLARQLAGEHGWQVCLYVDDLASFARICPAIEPHKAEQQQAGVLIRHWGPAFLASAAELAQVDLCIEAFACQIPASYLRQLADANKQALWVNLEYLTAESWAGGCHLLPSPQPGIALAKHFFFPGFTPDTGGLLREQQVVASARAIRQAAPASAASWQQLGIAPPQPDAFVITLFAYSQSGILSWFAGLAAQPGLTEVLVAEGALAQSLIRQLPQLSTGQWQQGNLRVRLIPFVAQQDYDLLLALSDFNFVRGEDSVIRAHWAGRPFVWQIYRQSEQAHLEKLQAFLQLMLADSPADFAEFWQQVHLLWEQETDFARCWPEIIRRYHEICQQTLNWQQKLTAQQDLVSNLVRFVENKHIISRNFS